MLLLLYSAALDSKLFAADGSDIKVRAFPYSNYKTGNKKIDFIHVTFKILSGRNAEQKEKLSNAVLKSLEVLNLLNFSISVEIVNIDRDSSSKAGV